MNTLGRHFRTSVFGESHGPVVGAVLDGVPPGMPIDLEAIRRRMQERRPGASHQVSARNEPDDVEILSGTYNGRATGAPLAFIVRNQDTRSQDYAAIAKTPRPGHADITEHWWSQGHRDPRGGGHRSGRLTAPLVAAAAIIAPWLEKAGIAVQATLSQVGATDSPSEYKAAIQAARKAKDSIGGVVFFTTTGVPPALGAPMMDGVSSKLGQALFAIPGVKAVEFGAGTAAAAMLGSDHNDAIRYDDDARIRFDSNHAGGTLGGRTSGEPITGQVTFKPTSSIAQPQTTVNLDTETTEEITIKGRHDPCIAVRGAPVVRAAVELVLADLLLEGASQGLAKVPRWPTQD